MNRKATQVLLLLVLTTGVLLSFTSCDLPDPPMTKEQVQERLTKLEHVTIPIDTTQPPVTTRNLYIIFDDSGSMSEDLTGCTGEKKAEFKNKLEGAKWAVQEWLKKVPPADNVGLCRFGFFGAKELIPIGTKNREAFLRAVEGIRSGGGTPLAESIHYATDRLVEQYQRQHGGGQYRIIIVTDGEAGGLPDAAEYAIARGFTIYTVGLCIGADHPLRHYSTSYRAADSISDMSQALEEFLAEAPEP